MKIAIIIGHHENGKGAYSKYFGQHEFDFYKKVCMYVHFVGAKFETRIFEHDKTISGYSTRVRATAAKVNEWGANLVICLHFNSFNKRANGCETLYFYASKKGKAYGELFNSMAADMFDVKNRGMKALTNTSDRGFREVQATKAPTILVEPFFGDNDEDCERVATHRRMACLINGFMSRVHELD